MLDEVISAVETLVTHTATVGGLVGRVENLLAEKNQLEAQVQTLLGHLKQAEQDIAGLVALGEKI